jgi:hypothetical protein
MLCSKSPKLITTIIIFLFFTNEITQRNDLYISQTQRNDLTLVKKERKWNDLYIIHFNFSSNFLRYKN